MNNKSRNYAKKILVLAIPTVFCGVGLQILPLANLKQASAEDIKIANIDTDPDEILSSSPRQGYTDGRSTPKPSPSPSPSPSPKPKPRK